MRTAQIENIQEVIVALLESIDYQGVLAMPTYSFSSSGSRLLLF